MEANGDLKPENAYRCVANGACVLVAASAVFNDRASVAENMAKLKEAVGRATRPV